MKTLGTHLATWLAGRGKLRRQLAPFVRYVVLLIAVVLLYGWLFHVIMAWEGQSHSWFTGIYWALTVMSTLGFGDITFETDVGRAFSTLVLVSGVVLMLIILPFLFIRYIYAPWIDEGVRRRVRRLHAVPDDVQDHVLICAHDPIAPGLVRRLGLAGVPAYVLEPDPERAMQLHDSGTPVVTGAIDSVETYRALGVERARMVLANSSDILNSNIVLTVRAITESLPVVAIAEVEDSIDVLELSGATHVLHLTNRLGEHLANRVSAGTALAHVIGDFHDLVIAEFPVHNTPLQGKTLRDARLREFTGVKVVGVWEQGRLHPAQPDLKLSPLSVPVVVGTKQQVQELNEMLVIYDANPNPVLVIGGGKVGRAAAAALKQRSIAVNVVERDRALESKIARIPDRLILGDAADRHVLEEAGIAETPSVLLTTHDDAMNVYLTVYCRRLNPDARILTRVTHERNVEAIRRAGADFVLSYATLGIQTVLSLVNQRELVVLGEDVNLFYMPVPSSLCGETLSGADIRARCGLHVIALQRNGELVTNPPPATTLPEGAELVALGTADQRERFAACFV
jgi:Trk K+ transport system NAD-binding subunit